MLLCLKCGVRVPDDHTDPCPGETDNECGAREWAFVDVPKQPLKFSKSDLVFLRVNRIAKD